MFRPQRESIDVERNEMEDRLDTLAITGDYEEEFPSLADNATKAPSALTGYSTTDKSYTVKERHKNGNFKQSVPQRNFQQQKVFQKVAGIGKSLASDEDFPSLTPTSVPTGGSGRSRQSASQSNWKSISHDHKLTSKKNQNPSSKAKKNPQKVGKSMDDFPSLPTKKAAKIPDFVDDYSEQNSTKPSWGKSSTSNSANQFSNDSSKYNQKGSTNTIKAAETLSNSKNKPKGKTKKKSSFSLQNNDNDNYKREESSSEVEKNWKGNATSNSTFNPSMPIGNRFQEDFPVLSSNGKPSDPFIPDQSHNEFAEMESVVTNPGLQDDYFGSSNSQTINEVNTVAATLYSEAMSNNFSDGDFPALPMKEKPTYDWLDNKKRDEASNSQWKIPSSNTSNFNTSVASTEQQLSTKVSVRPPPGISTISSHQDSGLNVRLTGDNMLMNDLLMESNNQDNSNNVKKSIKLPPGLRKNKVAAAAMSSNAEAMQRNDRYTPPTDAQKRQTKLITLISKNLKSTEKLNDFKKLSTDYRHKRLSAANFYSDCLNLFGDYFYQILPEMVALVPDIERQNDLFKIWCDSIDQIKSQRKIWRAVKNESSTDLETICTCLPCPSCGQIVIENDFDQHITYHSNFVIG